MLRVVGTRSRYFSLAIALAICGQLTLAQQSNVQAPARAPQSFLTLPADTSVGFVVVRPVFAKSAAVGNPVYLQTTFPVLVGDTVAIPSGSYALGALVALTKPTKKNSHAQVTVAFKQLVLPNGYTVLLDETQTLNVQVSTLNDLLLDNGTQAEIKLSKPVQLNARGVAASLPSSQTVHPETMRSATLCRPTPGTPGSPGTPGTPDTVIPGSPGTPDTVIPGVDGAPGTVIPGIPATSPIVIPGTPGTPDDPGTPGTVCPNPPLVVGSTPVPSAALPSATQPASTTH